ncbi:MAG: NosD domain-containing protein [Anaerolineales bacterium]
MTAVPNYHGILISTGSTANQIGDAGTGAGNLISGNEYAGIWMEHLATPGNTIAGNKIGTNLTGTGAVPNYYGIIHFAASNNLIGGTEPGAGNLISGNALEGVHIEHSSLNSLLGNTIGTDVTGEVAIPNVIRGIFIGGSTSNNTIGGSTPGAGNLISGSGEAGIFIQNYESVGNHILGNRIGTNRAGSSSLPNGTGVLVIGSQETIIGGADTGTPWVCDDPCNLISGNYNKGVIIQGTTASTTGQTRQGRTDRLVVADQDNQVLGNFIGTDLTGSSALPNHAGVVLSVEAKDNLIGGSSLLGEGNLISGNQHDGIAVRHPLTTNNQISGNRIGTTADGGSALPNGENGVRITEGASGNTVGGEGVGLGNLISGQATDPLYFGVSIDTYSEPEAIDNQVIGNLIGTNETGTSAIPNGGGVGVAYLVTGTVIRDNVISGNSLRGILILESTGNQVRDNNIGVAVDSLSPLPNDVFGIILFTAPHNIIGAGNTIAYNQVGIAIGYPESVGNTITQNSIYANTDEQIDFFEVPQPLAPAPLLTGWDGETVSGTACAGCQVEVFANPGPQPAGHTFLGTTTAAGDGTFSLTAGPGYRYLAATATDAEGTTSEFSTSLFIGTTSYVYLPLIVKAPGPLH